MLVFLASFMSGFSYASSTSDFSEETLHELATKAENVWREFAVNNLKQKETQGYIEQQILLKHGKEMYALWSQANNWEGAGKEELKEVRDALKKKFLFNAKPIIVGKLKAKEFAFLNPTSLKKLNQLVLLTIQKGKIKIEKDLTGGRHDLIFQYKPLDPVGFTQTKEYEETSDKPVLSKKKNAYVLVVVIGLYDFLDEIWKLTEKSGMIAEKEVLELIKSHPDRIKSIYPIPDYTF